MIKHKNKITAVIIFVILLAGVFWYGGNAPGLRGWTPEPKQNVMTVQNDKPAKEENASATEENKPQKQDKSPMTPAEKIAMAEKIAKSTQAFVKTNQSNEEQKMVVNEATEKDQHKTNPAPEDNPAPIEPENAVITDKDYTCTLSVRCDTILNNIGWLNSEKVDIIPKDGIIFPETIVTFYEGESVFNLLVREMKRNKIHLEFENIPLYGSAYIEGIANIYEFDCGELSGWMYKVNDWFPNYGSSRYQLKPGDRVELVYTCDLGNDVGGHYSARNGN